MPRNYRNRRTRLWDMWFQMNARCQLEWYPAFRFYGAKNIEVCEDWQYFERFASWARTHGYRDDLSIDRKDDQRGYNPENCHFIATSENRRKARRSFKPVVNDLGEKFPSIGAAAKQYGVGLSAISAAIHNEKESCGRKWYFDGTKAKRFIELYGRDGDQ